MVMEMDGDGRGLGDGDGDGTAHVAETHCMTDTLVVRIGSA